MVEVIFYRLGERPPMSGEVAVAALAEGRVSRGRKWRRLEATTHDAYLFPDDTTDDAICQWFDTQSDGVDWVAFSVAGRFVNLHNVPGNMVADAITFHKSGRKGWVVFE